MPVTIKDVAALAGVSPSTVSRTCKDHPSISRQTKEKVRQAMAKLGYEPNFQASSLATQNSRTVGIILPPSEWEAYQNPFYLEMIRGISQYCNQKQYINTVITGQNEDEILQAIKTMARTGLAEGFIVLYSREQDPVLDYLYEEGLLYVLIGKACRNVNQTIYVDNDNVLAGREAAEYLLNLGHVRIACLSGDHSLLYNHDRKMGYMLALAERGIPFDGQLCVEVPSVPEEQDQALAALAAVELPDPAGVYRKYPHELSGGMLQRAMIAAAVVARPKLLLLDEPTTALDVTIQAQILELLKKLNRESGISMLFISHNLNVVRKLCTRTAVMQRGVLVEEGDIETVFRHPRHPYTQRLIAAIPTRHRKEETP